MSICNLIRAIFCVQLMLIAQQSISQDDVQVLNDDVQLGIDFNFDDSAIFANAFDESITNTDSWLDDFTVKISQQFFGQVNNHQIEIAPDFSISKPAELENNRLGLNVRYQNPFAAGWLLQASGHARAYWVEDYEYKANDDRVDTEYRINEFFLQRSFDQYSIKIGRQTVVWGETEGNSVLDVINTTEFRDLTVIDIEDARLNQWMVVLDYYGEDSNISSFLNLYPEFNPAPVRGSPFFFEPTYNLTDYDRDKPLFEVGTQWRKTFERSDIAFMAAYLYENQLRYEDPVSGVGDSIAKKNDFLMLGFSANRAIGKLLLKFDLAFNKGVQANTFIIPGSGSISTALDIEKDEIGTSFGFEYGIDNDQNVSVGILARKLLDANDDLLPGQEVYNDGFFGNWLLRYSNNLRNGDLIISLTMQGDIEADSLLASLDFNYIINDNWAVLGQLTSIMADDVSPLLPFDEDVRLGATITYSF